MCLICFQIFLLQCNCCMNVENNAMQYCFRGFQIGTHVSKIFKLLCFFLVQKDK